jgi:hypothetical protein
VADGYRGAEGTSDELPGSEELLREARDHSDDDPPRDLEAGTSLPLSSDDRSTPDTRAAATRSVTDTPSERPIPAPTARGLGYRSPVGIGRLLRVLLGLWVIFAAVAAVASLAEYRLVSRLVDDPLLVSVSQLETSDDRQLVIGLIWILALVVTGIVFIVWMRRVYDNVRTLGSAPPRYSRGWTIGGWLVPFLSLVRPKQIMNDLWRASDPGLPSQAGNEWQQQRPSPLLAVWWALWLVGGFLGWILFSSRDTSDPESFRFLAGIDVAADLIMAAAAAAAFGVVALLTRRQETRAGRRFADYEAAEPSSARRRGFVAGVVAVAAVASIGVGFVAFDASPSRPATVSSGRGTLFDDLTVGDCWNSEEMATAGLGETVQMLGVEVVPCDQAHFGEVYNITTHPGGSSDPYPGDFEIEIETLEICIGMFGDSFNLSYESSSLDVVQFFPQGQSWGLGDRNVTCSVVASSLELLADRAIAVDAPLPGSDMNVLDATSCDDLVNLTVVNAQAQIDVWDSLTAEQLASLGPNDFAPGLERAVKRDGLIFLKALGLGCSFSDLNSGVIARASELESTTRDGEVFINLVSQDGWWDESLLP